MLLVTTCTSVVVETSCRVLKTGEWRIQRTISTEEESVDIDNYRRDRMSMFPNFITSTKNKDRKGVGV